MEVNKQIGCEHNIMRAEFPILLKEKTDSIVHLDCEKVPIFIMYSPKKKRFSVVCKTLFLIYFINTNVISLAYTVYHHCTIYVEGSLQLKQCNCPI